MAKIFAVRSKQAYPEPHLDIILMDADCIEFLMRSVRRRFEEFGVNPFVSFYLDFVYMHFEAWELENLKREQAINDFFQMFGKSGMIETGDLYMKIPVESVLLLEQALIEAEAKP